MWAAKLRKRYLRLKTNLSRPPTDSGRGIPEIPDFELLRWIGGGAYGEVWLGRSVTGAYRAVKVVWREDFELERTFEKEFEGIRHFEPVSRRHHGVVDIYHVGRNGKEGFYYYVMELADDVVRGQDIVPEKYIPKTLSKVMKEGELGWEICQETGVDLARALNHLHVNGLAHRDIKPSNVIFVDGKAKLADIGLVACSGEMAYVGTDGYVPPEGAGTAAGDIYSLGKVLYEMSTGYDRMEFPAVPISRLDSADATQWREINEIVCQACTPVSKKRFPSAAAMAANLDTVGEVVPPPNLIPALVAIAAVATMLVAPALMWVAWGGTEILADAPEAPKPAVVQVAPAPDPPEIVQAPEVQSTEDLAKQPKPKQVWKNSVGLEFDPGEHNHISRYAIEHKLFNDYVEETLRPFRGEVINFKPGAPGVQVRNTVAVPAQDAVAFCRWMEAKDRNKGFLSSDHYYDIKHFDDYSETVDPEVTGPSNPENIAFRCVVAKRDYGEVRIDSEPSGADVLFRGKKIGVTPFRRRDFPIGRVRYEVKKKGYRVFEVAGTVKPEGHCMVPAK